jgi:hypothetical protein
VFRSDPLVPTRTFETGARDHAWPREGPDGCSRIDH